MSSQTPLRVYNVHTLLQDSAFRRGICSISSACSGGGTVSTVNGQTPDGSGNVEIDLQSTTDGTGNNITSNSIQVTGLGNIDPTIDSSSLSNIAGALRLHNFQGGVPVGEVTINPNGEVVLTATALGGTSITVREEDPINAGIYTIYRVSAANGINNQDVVTIQQLNTKLTATPGAAVADATDEPSVVIQFNALLASLRAAGIIET